jgi:hypothetical protein
MAARCLSFLLRKVIPRLTSDSCRGDLPAGCSNKCGYGNPKNYPAVVSAILPFVCTVRQAQGIACGRARLLFALLKKPASDTLDAGFFSGQQEHNARPPAMR